MAGKRILIVATLDTKGEETLFLRDKIRELGKDALVLDISMREGIYCQQADIPAPEVAEAGGSSLAEIFASRDRAANTRVMTRGAAAITGRLLREKRIHGVIGIGGSTGTLIATDVMRGLPFGVPKFVVSSTAALPGMSTRYIGTGDICLMHSVIEISGTNELLKNVIERSARAICAMAEVPAPGIRTEAGKGKRIALTMLGPCEKCASFVRRGLEEKGYQVTGFSAAGVGDRVMEEMIRQGFFDGVVDLAPGGVLEHLVGGMRDAGPLRLEAAGEAGIPQVISTCGLNHVTPAKKSYTEEHKTRRKYDLDRHRTWLRASPEELRRAARVIAEKLNKSKGPVKVLIPTKGWSSVDLPGNPNYDPGEDMIFAEELGKFLKSAIEVRTIAANLEETAFARELLAACAEIFGSKGNEPAFLEGVIR
ncbi:MAG: Tm-1-like ATP-binding domain-containing protein [Bacillota bacterium]